MARSLPQLTTPCPGRSTGCTTTRASPSRSSSSSPASSPRAGWRRTDAPPSATRCRWSGAATCASPSPTSPRWHWPSPAPHWPISGSTTRRSRRRRISFNSSPTPCCSIHCSASTRCQPGFGTSPSISSSSRWRRCCCGPGAASGRRSCWRQVPCRYSGGTATRRSTTGRSTSSAPTRSARPPGGLAMSAGQQGGSLSSPPSPSPRCWSISACASPSPWPSPSCWHSAGATACWNAGRTGRRSPSSAGFPTRCS